MIIPISEDTELTLRLCPWYTRVESFLRAKIQNIKEIFAKSSEIAIFEF